MARHRSPMRDEAKKIWLASGGTLVAKDIAERTGVTPERARKWKSEDRWQVALEEQNAKRKRGGQPHNNNAEGAGAPYRNNNALTHGAYATIYLDDLPEDRRAYIESITLDTATNMLRELQLLMAKEDDLKCRICILENDDTSAMHIDRVVEMFVPCNKEDEESYSEQEAERLKTSMKTVIKTSSFERAMKLEAELNKIHGRIIKLLDSIKSYELDSRRVMLEERKYNLAKQKLSGEYEINPITGEIDDETNEESADFEV